MHPSMSEQLDGLSGILRDVVAPDLSSPYPVDVLESVMATLDMLSRSWAEVPRFLLSDAAATADVLRMIGLNPPQPPDAQFDIEALESYHADVRSMLERAITSVLAHPAAHVATVRLFRDRNERFPFQPMAPRRP